MAYNNQRSNNQRTTNQRPNNQAPAGAKFTDLSGREMRVFIKDFGNRISASTDISRKNQDGTYDGMYIYVKFVQCDAPTGEGVHSIKINSGFWSCYCSNKHETMLPEIVILDYEEI